MSIRPVKRIVQSTPAIEGAGVRLRRAEADRGAGRVVRPHRDERPGGAPAGRLPSCATESFIEQ